MPNFFQSSIGRKLIMSISGIFLMLFLLVHLGVNLLLLVGDGTTFNQAAHFMTTNPIVRVIEPLLAVGFVIHIFYSGIITFQNMRARPQKYKSGVTGVTTWPARNMFILGGLILIFLVIHLANFFWKIKFGDMPYIEVQGEAMHDIYGLVSRLFMEYWWYDLIYVVGGIFLGLHLTHGFWSAFQTIGWDNETWLPRLEKVAYVFAFIIAGGFCIIPIYFFLIANF